jgi:hypothetical protein
VVAVAIAHPAIYRAFRRPFLACDCSCSFLSQLNSSLDEKINREDAPEAPEAPYWLKKR